MSDYRGRRANTCPDLDSMMDYEPLPLQRCRDSSMPPCRNRASSGNAVRTRASSHDSLARARMRAESLRAAGYGSYDSLQGGDLDYQFDEERRQYGDLKVRFGGSSKGDFGGSGGNFGQPQGHFQSGESDYNFVDSSYTRFGLSASTSRILSDSTYNRFISSSGYSKFGRTSSGSRLLNNSSLRRFAKDLNQNSYSQANFSTKGNLSNNNFKRNEDFSSYSSRPSSSRNNSLTSNLSGNSSYSSNTASSPGSPEQHSGRINHNVTYFSKTGAGGTVDCGDTHPSPNLAKLEDNKFFSSNTWSPSRPRGLKKGSDAEEQCDVGDWGVVAKKDDPISEVGREGVEVSAGAQLQANRRVSDAGYSSLGTLSSVRLGNRVDHGVKLRIVHVRERNVISIPTTIFPSERGLSNT